MAGRPQKPLASAIASGAILLNPKRYTEREKNHPGQALPLGPISAPLLASAGNFRSHVAAAWMDFSREIPWLKESDRALVEMASLLRASIYLDGLDVIKVPESKHPALARGMWTINLNSMGMLLRILTQLGATPATIAKVQHGLGKTEDEDDEFAWKN